MKEIVEYLYEKAVKLSLPITSVPKTLPAFIGSFVGKQMAPPVSIILAMNRAEFIRFIQLMMQYERYGKENAIKSSALKATPLSRRAYPNAVRERNDVYKKLCLKHTRLCEIFRLMERVNDDFIAYVNIGAALLGGDHGGTSGYNQHRVEFSVGLGGFDILGKDGKRVPAYELKRVNDKWEQVCADEKFFNDFSLLINKAGMNAIVFLMDYRFETYHK